MWGVQPLHYLVTSALKSSKSTYARWRHLFIPFLRLKRQMSQTKDRSGEKSHDRQDHYK